jgi:ribosome recycling factor
MSEMVDLVLDDVDGKSKKIEESLKKHLGKIRTGRASVSLLDDIKADYYGVLTPIRQMSNINIPEPRLMVIQPYDPSVLKEIEKAIVASDLGLNPHNDGKVLRVVIPELTEERRKELIKVVKKIAEEHRVSVRQVRRDGNEELKKAEKDKDITEDDLHKGMDLVQKKVDKSIERIDKMVEAKEKELLEV